MFKNRKRFVLTVTTISDCAVAHQDVRKFDTRQEARNTRDYLLAGYETIYDGGTDVSDIRIYTVSDGGYETTYGGIDVPDIRAYTVSDTIIIHTAITGPRYMGAS